MPLIRYFVFTGGALLALLYLADYYLAGPLSAAAETGPDLSIARIHSAQTWPEKIVFDTNVRQIPLTKTVASTSDAAAPVAPDGTRQAFAMAAQPAAEPRQAKAASPNKRVAERHRRRQPSRMAARGQFFNEPVAAEW
ncbi:hypothetical protein [Bradyrhizobium sp. WSM1253]|uniref:hypothetical protein n=1 Tax=Bradyrhizobium sp. WSM1253 TaxID=319003 RepID=UPI00025D24EC|nr:hypothetical protein [Bradyrhizobium sp. WSM1253]EIG58151.1 hypothetical protein Bra1253DRAFT_02844 [Bradyrhizobium sp. WSM1253]